MPYMKAIAGHANTVGYLAQYLEKDGRALASDFINIQEVGYDGLPWDRAMDLTRRECGTDKSHAGKRTRHYEHIIVSLDERDADVTLEEFQDFVTSWAESWFNDRLGQYQVAIVYHDDNDERRERGVSGILHAHIVVNNTELQTSTRLAPKLTRSAVQTMRYELNRDAAARGWHAFATNGESLTQAEMDARGLQVSRGRAFDQNIDAVVGVDAIRGEEADEADHGSPDDPGATPEPFVPGPGDDPYYTEDEDIAAARRRHPGVDPDSIGSFTAVFSDGTIMRKGPVQRPAQPRTDTMPERKTLRREGHSWKQDIRDRVDVAVRMSRTAAEFSDFCAMQGVTVDMNRRGELRYKIDGAPLGRRVLGTSLGFAYTAESVNQALSMRNIERAQRSTAKRGVARYVREPERDAVMRAASRVEPGTREGALEFKQMLELIRYNDVNRITSYAAYPEDSDGARMLEVARSLGIFDAAPASSSPLTTPPSDPDSILEAAAREREERGEGGLEAGHIASVTDDPRRSEDTDSTGEAHSRSRSDRRG